MRTILSKLGAKDRAHATMIGFEGWLLQLVCLPLRLQVVCAAIGAFMIVGPWTPIFVALAAVDLAWHGFASPA